jgi:hypothetical protein
MLYKVVVLANGASGATFHVSVDAGIELERGPVIINLDGEARGVFLAQEAGLVVVELRD